MLDLKKRLTIKSLSLLPLVSIPGLAKAVSTSVQDADTPSQTLPPAAPRHNMALQIQIINSSAVPDNNVIIRNTSDEELIVKRFMPGVVYFDNQVVDLNEAANNKALQLQPGQSKALHFTVQPVSDTVPIEYVWADHAVDALNSETSIVTLGAFMADTYAVVYANTNQYIIS